MCGDVKLMNEKGAQIKLKTLSSCFEKIRVILKIRFHFF